MPTSDERPVAALYERWVKAGPPPLGVSLARWWDRRLIELRDAINAPAATEPETVARDLTAALRERRPPIRQYPDERREAAETDMLAVFPPETERSDIGTEFVHQIDNPDDAGLTAFEADLASKTQPKADSKSGPCRTTQHCAYHGWCRRCAPAFAATMSRVNVAIQRTDDNESHWGPLHEAIGKALNNGEECPRTTADNPPTSSDTPDNPLRDQS